MAHKTWISLGQITMGFTINPSPPHVLQSVFISAVSQMIVVSEALRFTVKAVENVVVLKRMSYKAQDPCLKLQPLSIPC